MSGETQEEPLAGDALDQGSSEKASDHGSNDNNDDPAEAEGKGEDEIDFSQRPLHKLPDKMAKDKPQAFETDLDELRTLLDLEETEIDLPHTDGKTALHVAAEKGLVEAAKVLIDAGASLSKKEDKERRPLHLA